jgi:hypothetical protein
MDVQIQSVNPQRVAGVADPGYSYNSEYLRAVRAFRVLGSA